jgi:type IV pilus assembly protein PilA
MKCGASTADSQCMQTQSRRRIGPGTGYEEGGFTLVELLVVLMIIGALVAIALPTFVKQREKGFRAQMEAALKDGSTAMEGWATENAGSYSGTTLAELEPGGLHDQGLNYADRVTLDLTSTETSYCIEATHSEFDLVLHISSDQGKPTVGPCP